MKQRREIAGIRNMKTISPPPSTFSKKILFFNLNDEVHLGDVREDLIERVKKPKH